MTKAASFVLVMILVNPSKSARKVLYGLLTETSILVLLTASENNLVFGFKYFLVILPIIYLFFPFVFYLILRPLFYISTNNINRENILWKLIRSVDYFFV